MEPRNLSEPLFPPLPPLTEDEARQNAVQHQREQREGKLLFIGFVRWCVVVGCISLVLILYDKFTQKPFNSEAWKRAVSSGQVSERAAMSDDLVYGDRLIGLSRSQMIELLGKPDDEPVRDWDVGYSLGTSFMSVNMLLLKFDEQKQISDCQIITVD